MRRPSVRMTRRSRRRARAVSSSANSGSVPRSASTRRCVRVSPRSASVRSMLIIGVMPTPPASSTSPAEPGAASVENEPCGPSSHTLLPVRSVDRSPEKSPWSRTVELDASGHPRAGGDRERVLLGADHPALAGAARRTGRARTAGRRGAGAPGRAPACSPSRSRGARRRRRRRPGARTAGATPSGAASTPSSTSTSAESTTRITGSVTRLPSQKTCRPARTSAAPASRTCSRAQIS